MTVRKPVVLNGGQLELLQSGDKIDGSGAAGAIRYQYDSTTNTGVDPGAGKFRLNIPPSTEMAISETDADGNDVSSWINSWDDSTNVLRGKLFLMKEGTGSLFIYNVLGSNVDNGGWDQIDISEMLAGSFTNGDYIRIWFQPTGNDGSDGAAGADGIDGLSIPGCRLTLESHVPVSTSDQASKSTIYYTAFKHGGVPLYDGSSWATYYLPGGEISASVPSATSSAKPFDVFVYLDSGSPALEFIEWSSTTARATNIINTSSPYLYTKTGDPSRLYIGTIHCTTSGQTSDAERTRYVWNMYNRVHRHLFWQGPNTTWTYGAGSTRFVNAVSNPHLAIVVGLAEDLVEFTAHVTARKSVGTTNTAVEIGITRGSTPSTFDTLAQAGVIRSDTDTELDNRTLIAKKIETAPQGWQEYNWCERTGTASATIAFTGTNVNECGMLGNFTC